jgi:hypothetical protein
MLERYNHSPSTRLSFPDAQHLIFWLISRLIKLTSVSYQLGYMERKANRLKTLLNYYKNHKELEDFDIDEATQELSIMRVMSD